MEPNTDVEMTEALVDVRRDNTTFSMETVTCELMDFFDETSTSLPSTQISASPRLCIAVVDTNFFILHHQWLRDNKGIRWGNIPHQGVFVVLVIPWIVLGELDMLKV